MTFVSWLQNIITVTEADVNSVIVKIKQGIAVEQKYVNYAMTWIANEIPKVASVIQDIETIAQAIAGIEPVIAPEVEAAIAAANITMAGLNKFAAAHAAGASTPQTLLAAYVAVKQASAAASNAMAVTVSAQTPQSAAPAATPTA